MLSKGLEIRIVRECGFANACESTQFMNRVPKGVSCKEQSM